MRYEDYIGIETPITYKFNNNLLPGLPNIIRDYLFQNPEKTCLYLDKSLTVDDVIKAVALNKDLQSKAIIEPSDILNVIIEYVEGRNAN